jgi:hypothetical protein
VPPQALRHQAAAVPLVAAVVPQPENLHTRTPSRALALARRCRSVTGVRHHGLETRSPPSAGVSFLHRSSILVTRAGRCFQGHLHTKLQPSTCLRRHHLLVRSLFSGRLRPPPLVSSSSTCTCFSVRPSCSPSCLHMHTLIRSISTHLVSVNSNLHARQGRPLKLAVVVQRPVYEASVGASFLISSTYVVHHHLSSSQGTKLHQYAIVMVYFIL